MTTVAVPAEEKSRLAAGPNGVQKTSEESPVYTQLALFDLPHALPQVSKGRREAADTRARKPRKRRGGADPDQPTLFPDLH